MDRRRGHRHRALREVSGGRSADDPVHRSPRTRACARRIRRRPEDVERAEARSDSDGLARGMEGHAGAVSRLGDLFRPTMRGYFIPLTAGLLLAASTWLPWVII